MSTAQKIIKYLSIAFGIFLTVIICSAIFLAVHIFMDIFVVDEVYDDKSSYIEDNDYFYDEIFDEKTINDIDIELSVSKLYVYTSSELRVSITNMNDRINVKTEDNQLIISEKGNENLINNDDYAIVTLYVPYEMELGNLTINSGVGDIEVTSIDTAQLDVEIGVGKFNIKDSNSKNTKIEGGVGNLDISNSDLGKLDLKAGIGNCDIDATLENESKIETGLGNVKIKLTDGKDKYYFDIESGLGNIKLDGQKITSGRYGNNEGKNVTIKGGAGNIKIS